MIKRFVTVILLAAALVCSAKDSDKKATSYSHPLNWKKVQIHTLTPIDSVRVVGIKNTFYRVGHNTIEGYIPEGAWLRYDGRSQSRPGNYYTFLLKYKGQSTIYFRRIEGVGIGTSTTKRGKPTVAAMWLSPGSFSDKKALKKKLRGIKKVPCLVIPVDEEFLYKKALRELKPEAIVITWVKEEMNQKLVALEKFETLEALMIPSISDLKSSLVNRNLKCFVYNCHSAEIVQSDLTPFKRMDELEYLEFVRSAKIKDFSPLAECKSLRGLDLGDNASIKSFDFLSKMRKLHSLNTVSPISDFAPLTKLKKLSSVHIKLADTVANVTTFAEKKSLTNLTIENVSPTFFEALKSEHLFRMVWNGGGDASSLNVKFPATASLRFPYLKELKLTDYENVSSLNINMVAASWKEVKELPNKMTSLTLTSCTGLKNFKDMPEAENLKVITLYNVDHLESFEGISKYKKLERLYIHGCKKLVNLKGLESSKLKSLMLRHSTVKNLEGLNASKLEFLYISHSKFESFNGLKGANYLTYALIEHCDKFIDATYLRNAPKLETMAISHCVKIKDMSVLSKLRKLLFLSLSGCESIDSDKYFIKNKRLDYIKLPPRFSSYHVKERIKKVMKDTRVD